MTKPPAFQFYAKDWLASRQVKMMSPEQRGYYIQLLAEAWDSKEPGTLPVDVEDLWFLAGASSRAEFERPLTDFGTVRVCDLVLKQFPVLDGKRVNERLLIERQRQLARSDKQRDKALARWEKPKESKTPKPRHSRGNAEKKSRHASGNALPLHLPLQSASATKTLKPSGASAPDPRHDPVRAVIKQREAERLQLPLDQVPWDGRAGKALADWLAANPKAPVKLVIDLVECHYDSPARIGLLFTEWIPQLWKYKGGPINQFGTRLAEDRDYQREQRMKSESRVGMQEKKKA
jgi:uncharacterized protein YdaU (DUF1376 family)